MSEIDNQNIEAHFIGPELIQLTNFRYNEDP